MDLRVGICAIAKDEGSYLEEWVAYHHLMGFAPIRVYAHECTDNSHAVLTRLSRAGLCEWQPFTAPDRRKPQWLAYEHGMEALRDRTDWVAFIDLDEFIVTPRHPSIQAFLAEYGHLGAIAMNWKLFGSGGHQTREPGLVIERFTRCAPRAFRSNRMVKTLARTDRIRVPRVHTAHFVPGTVYQTVIGEEMGEQNGIAEGVDHSAIRVNHYFTRSWEEWEAKAARGKGAKRRNSPIKHRSEDDFRAHDRNDEEDTLALRWVAPVKQLIADVNVAELDIAHQELDLATRRVRRLEADNTRLHDALRAAEDRHAAALVALNAEAERTEMLEQRIERARRSASWRVGSRAVKLARLLTFRRTRGESALDLRQPDASATSPASLSSQTTSPAA